LFNFEEIYQKKEAVLGGFTLSFLKKALQEYS